MSLWIVPVGFTVNGVLCVERFVTGPARVTDLFGVQHGPEIFLLWSPEELALIGIKSFSEDAVPTFYIPGEPVFVETETHVQKTYPNMERDAEAALESALNAIAVKYDAKREALSRDMSRALLVDGATLDTNVQALRDRWAALADAENTEIEALFT